MDALEAIFTRRSVRKFTDKPIEEEKLRQILEAAMSGPSCVNARDWAFVAVTEKEKLRQMAQANGRPAQPLKEAAAGRPQASFSSLTSWMELSASRKLI